MVLDLPPFRLGLTRPEAGTGAGTAPEAGTDPDTKDVFDLVLTLILFLVLPLEYFASVLSNLELELKLELELAARVVRNSTTSSSYSLLRLKYMECEGESPSLRFLPVPATGLTSGVILS